jgi:translation initiation factor IF-2
MNITELARRLRVRPQELQEKLPDLGFAVGKKAIKIDNRQAQRIMEAWGEMMRKQRLAQKMEQQKFLADRKTNRKPEEMKRVLIPSVISVRDFASRLELPVPRVMQELMRNGILAAINQPIDFDTASIIAEDLGFIAQKEAKTIEEDMEGQEKIRQRVEEKKDEHFEPRAPVVVVMGHVDHGKTKLLDAIRQTHVMETEAGGITQHIGAYQVAHSQKMDASSRATEVSRGISRNLTFIDTPGHEAFTVMRSRGAKVADIAILVVAADDGVQPQTKEAVNIIKSAGLPFLVALNKIDREQANIDKVKSELAELGLVPEDWGGQTIVVPISAKQGTNIDGLLDMLLLVADIEKERIVANPNHRALGTVIESHVDPGSGPVATVLVQSGTLHVGDTLSIRGILYGRVRAMHDWKRENIKIAVPSTPAEIIGWKITPAVGDIMEVPEAGAELKHIKATDSSLKATEEVAFIRHTQSSEESDDSHDGKKIINFIIRCDVLGSLEAILGMLDKIKHEQVGVKIVQKGLGNITDADVLSAEATHAIIIGFNVHPTSTAENLARDKKVEIREYQIIYKLFEQIIRDLQELLPSETVITERGTFGVMKNFRKTDAGWIIGGRVKTGVLTPGCKLRLSRNEEYVGEGQIEKIQLGKSAMKEATEGQEIGINYRGKIKPDDGDVLEAYTEEIKTQKLKIAGINLR